ncbi:hypothetical protein [Gulosibacter hominis]|uniref:hypothetical protein n=1 Tax=Gulosibacter hominis TaxID=2770504 RepID=UPI00191A1DC1|nr:hypothetical protein [Gulosibacter hominis]
MLTRNRKLLASVSTALATLALTSCATISNADPEADPAPGGDTASQTVEKYFAAIESSDKEAISKIAANEVSPDKIQLPKVPAELESIENAPEANPRPIDRRIASVTVTYKVESDSYQWDATLRYDDAGWRIIDPFITINPLGESGDSFEEDQFDSAPTSDEPLYVPGKHQVDAATTSKYLTSPEEGVDVALVFPAADDEMGNAGRINEALKDAKFSLSPDGEKAAITQIEAFREKCKNWCTESYYNLSFDQHDPERQSSVGVFRYAPDAGNPDKITLIDKHSSEWQTWYEKHAGRYSSDPAYFVLVEPVSIEYSNYVCKYENGSTDCHYAESGSDKYVLDQDVAFIYRISGEELSLVEIRNNG